jgi:ribosomal protein S18 acetylase RimI-like enzyme
MAGTNDVVIRQATIDDAEVLAELGARLFEQTFGPVNTREDMEAYLPSAFSPDIQRAELAEPDRIALIAFDETGMPVGYAMTRRGSRSSGVVSARPVEIQRIYVDRTLHGRGLGDRLMNSCVEQARAWNADLLWLAVWEQNARAIAFYKRSGFAVIGGQDFVLGSDVQHDLVMGRPMD